MPNMTVEVGSANHSVLNLFRWVGERFQLTFSFIDRADDTALDVSAGTFAMTLGTITKADIDFDEAGLESNQTSVWVEIADIPNAGLYRGQVTATLATQTVKSPIIVLLIDSGSAVISIDEIRMAMLDTSSQNEFLNTEEFPDEMLFFARQNALNRYNAWPGEHANLTLESFPSADAYYLQMGAIAEALKMKALNYARDDMQLEAGGVTANDKNKAEAYLSIAQLYQGEWDVYIKRTHYLNDALLGFRSLSMSRGY